MPDAAARPTAPAEVAKGPRPRLAAIDQLRGLAIVIMVLDHVRHFFHAASLEFDPTNLDHTTPALFLTRWITHLCAPAFVFLSGISIYLQEMNGKPKSELSRFLVTRGIWLIFLEVTLVGLGFNFGAGLLLQVIWAIGASFILLAAVVWLPYQVSLALGVLVVIVFGLIVGPQPPAPALKPLWNLFVWSGQPDPLPGSVSYPVLPWFGVMVLGYAFGPVMRKPASAQVRWMLGLGVAGVALFGLLTVITVLGRSPAEARSGVYEIMALANVRKYPPSLGFISLMTGLSLLLFAAMYRLKRVVAGVLEDFGRVSLFSYVSHLYIAHLMALLVGMLMGYPAWIFFEMRDEPDRAIGVGWGFGLPVTYLAWIATLLIMYPMVRWFSHLKRRRRDWWLSYL